jgi:hypothetical protein
VSEATASGQECPSHGLSGAQELSVRVLSAVLVTLVRGGTAGAAERRPHAGVGESGQETGAWRAVA